MRLSRETREFAYRSMHGKYGDEGRETPAVEIEAADVSNRELYRRFLYAIAENAPLRLCPEEKLCGSATLGDAIDGWVPARMGDRRIGHISHLTVDFEDILKHGLSHREKRIKEELAKEQNEENREYLSLLCDTVEAFRIWHGRYLRETEKSRPDLYEILKKVPFSPAETFHEALQAVWMEFAFIRLYGNWPGIGRIDVLLGDYLKRDLSEKRITRKEARELLASFFIKGCEWIESDAHPAGGDAQHYQNIILGGTDEKGEDVTNEVTYLVLDIIEETGISDFPVTVRLHKKTPEKLLRKCASVVRHGGGVVAFYGEKTVMAAMKKAGYPAEKLWRFANDGCWETQIPGETSFEYIPFDSLQLLNRAMGLYDSEPKSFSSYEELYEAFLRELKECIDGMFRARVRDSYKKIGDRWECVRNANCETSVVDIFTRGCMENRRPYGKLGPRYTVLSPHLGGGADTANSLLAVNELVFKRGLISYGELTELLKNNWQGGEALRLFAKNKLTYYGNDDDEADSYAVRLISDFAAIVENAVNTIPDCPVKFVPGVSTFGRQIDWLPQRCATAFGGRKGDILAPNASPTPGTDVSGVTARIRSYCKTDLVGMTTGSALDIKLYPETVSGEDGIGVICALLRGFEREGGYFMQIDIVDKKVLRAARRDPEAYKTLSVRVSGWNARFVTLERKWQEMIEEGCR